jgi:hypothetical protein
MVLRDIRGTVEADERLAPLRGLLPDGWADVNVSTALGWCSEVPPHAPGDRPVPTRPREPDGP